MGNKSSNLAVIDNKTFEATQVVDLNRFKVISDKHGHGRRDKALAAAEIVAKRSGMNQVVTAV